jgi:hypothetical protein
MTKRTRYFLIGSIAFLVIGLAAGLVAYYGGIPGAFAQNAGPQELRYVPKDAVVVAFANVQELMNSEFRQRVKALEPAEHEHGRDELRNATGIDVEHDVDYVVAYMTADPAAEGQKSGAVLARGRFDVPRIQAYIREKGGIERDYLGKKVFLAPEHMDVEADSEATEPAETQAPRHEHPQMALAFLADNVVAFGTEAALRKTIDLEHGAPNVTANSELVRMIEGVDQGNAWAVGRFDMLTASAHLPSGVSDKIPAITWFSATGHVNGGVSATLNVEAKDKEAADNLRQVINGFMALARLQAGSNSNRPEVASMLQSIQLGGADKTVSVSFTLPAQALDMFKNTAPAPAATPHH